MQSGTLSEKGSFQRRVKQSMILNVSHFHHQITTEPRALEDLYRIQPGIVFKPSRVKCSELSSLIEMSKSASNRQNPTRLLHQIIIIITLFTADQETVFS